MAELDNSLCQADGRIDTQHRVAERYVSMPKSTTEINRALKTSLFKLGTINAFNSCNANLLGMACLTPDQNMCVSKATHYVFVDVN